MNIKPLPKTPKLPTSVTDNGADLIKAMYSQLSDILTTTNRLVVMANDEDWKAPALVSPWVNATGYAPAGYYKDGQSIVRLRGVIQGGATGTIFTLPNGYRPPHTAIYANLANNVLCRIDIYVDGRVVWVSGGTNAWLSLDNISFRVG